MRFIVRYWSSILPMEYCKADGSPRLVDYSIHPPTRLGLHNALLSYHDRVEILEAHGGQYECKVYVEEGINSYILTQDEAISMFNTLPNGEVKWTTIRKCLLGQIQEVHSPAGTGDISYEQQLHMFEHEQESDVDTPSHHFDIDA